MNRLNLNLNEWLTGSVVYIVAKGRQPLYIGTSRNGLQRAMMHFYPNRKPWALEANRMCVIRFPTDDEAILAESWLIETLRPSGNLVRRRRLAATVSPEFLDELTAIAKKYKPQQPIPSTRVYRRWIQSPVIERNLP